AIDQCGHHQSDFSICGARLAPEQRCRAILEHLRLTVDGLESPADYGRAWSCAVFCAGAVTSRDCVGRQKWTKSCEPRTLGNGGRSPNASKVNKCAAAGNRAQAGDVTYDCQNDVGTRGNREDWSQSCRAAAGAGIVRTDRIALRGGALRLESAIDV